MDGEVRSRQHQHRCTASNDMSDWSIVDTRARAGSSLEVLKGHKKAVIGRTSQSSEPSSETTQRARVEESGNGTHTQRSPRKKKRSRV